MPTAAKKTASRKTSSRRSAPDTAKPTTASGSPKAKSSADPPVENGLVWTGSLDLTRAAELTAALRKALADSDSVSLTLREVDSADLSFVQILLAATHTAKEAGKSLRLIDESDSIEALCQEVGFGTIYQRLVSQEPEVIA